MLKSSDFRASRKRSAFWSISPWLLYPCLSGFLSVRDNDNRAFYLIGERLIGVDFGGSNSDSGRVGCHHASGTSVTPILTCAGTAVLTKMHIEGSLV